MSATESEWVDAAAKALIDLQPGTYVSQTIAQCYENAEAVVAAIEPLIRTSERKRHHWMEVQGGSVRTCCSVCKTHVQPHVRCMLRDDYTGPLPKGHRWEDDA